MGVSITDGGNVDLDAIVAGGDAFLARIKTLKEVKADADASLEALRIGRDAAGALREAQAREQAAQKLVIDAKAEADSIIEKAERDGAEIKRQAQIAADELAAKARGHADTLNAEIDNAQQVLAEWSRKTTAEAEAVMARAAAAEAAAAKRLKDNVAAGKELAVSNQQALQAAEAAKATQAALDAKIEAIKAAAS